MILNPVVTPALLNSQASQQPKLYPGHSFQADESGAVEGQRAAVASDDLAAEGQVEGVGFVAQNQSVSAVKSRADDSAPSNIYPQSALSSKPKAVAELDDILFSNSAVNSAQLKQPLLQQADSDEQTTQLHLKANAANSELLNIAREFDLPASQSGASAGSKKEFVLGDLYAALDDS